MALLPRFEGFRRGVGEQDELNAEAFVGAGLMHFKKLDRI